MSETGLLLAEIQALKRRIQSLETVTEHPGFAASDAARKSLTLAQFAATTSAELAGVLSDETGYSAGAKAVFSIAPVFGTSISAPALVTASGALTITPAAGSGVAIVLSTTGDFVINTNQLVVDTSTGRIASGTTAASAAAQLHIKRNSGALVGQNGFIRIEGDNTATNGVVGFEFYESSTIVGTLQSRLSGVSSPNEFRFVTFGTNVINFITGVSSTSRLYINDTGIGIGTTAPTYLVSLGGGAARTIWMERRTTSNTAGNSLTVQAGGATVSATDKAGGDLNLSPGITTGMGRANVRLKRYGRAAATSTADNTAADGLVVAGAVNLTDAATSMFEVALAAGDSAGGCIIWTIRASDGTDMQAYTGVTTFSAVNKAGTYTTTVTSDAANDAKAVSAGTLTAAFTLLNGANRVTMQVTPAGSLTETTYQMSYTIFNNSPQAITIL